MTTPLTTFLGRIGWREPALGTEAVAEWPVGCLKRLAAIGVLVPASPAETVACDGCDDHHVEAVVWVDALPHPRRAFVPCPHHGRVEVDPARLRRWAFWPGVFAERVAEAGEFAGGVTELEAGRVWRLGKTTAAGRPVVVYLARGLDWDDGTALVARTPALQAEGVAVFVPHAIPRRDVWAGGPIPSLVSLADALALGDTGFLFDHSALTASFPRSSHAAAEPAILTFPTPAGARWGDVRLTVGETELVVSCGSVTRRFQYDAIGFADRRKTGTPPDQVWHLLRLLAEHRGTIPTKSRDGVVVPDGLKQRVHTLNERLTAVFRLDDPAVKHVRRTGDYQVACAVSSSTPARHPLPHDAAWDDVALTELADGRIEVAVDGTEKRAGASGGVVWTRRYALRDLGLADGHDAPTPAGDSFLRLLRGGGRLGPDAGERGRLELNRWLSAFFDRPEPFAVRRSGEWVAKFVAASHARPRS